MRGPPRLVALTPGSLTPPELGRFVRGVERAVEAGLEGILVREPGLSDRAFLDLTREVRRALERTPSGWLGVHDRAHLAPLARADGVHLGFRSLAPRAVRRWLPPEIAVGLSAHAPDDPAAWEGADYLFFGPVRPTESKEGLVEPIGLAGLALGVARARPVPVLAIGGLRPEDAHDALEAGVRGIAVRAGIFGAEDPAAAVRRYRSALGP